MESLEQTRCARCDKSFERGNVASKVYCSRLCKLLSNKKAYRVRKREKSIASYGDVTCLHCSHPFRPLRRGKKYCSRNCKSAAGNKRRQQKREKVVLPFRQCIVCQHAFMPSRSNMIKCSEPHCRIQYERVSYAKRTCDCGGKFAPTRRDSNACSKRCRDRIRERKQRRLARQLGLVGKPNTSNLKAGDWLGYRRIVEIEERLGRPDPYNRGRVYKRLFVRLQCVCGSSVWKSARRANSQINWGSRGLSCQQCGNFRSNMRRAHPNLTDMEIQRMLVNRLEVNLIAAASATMK